MRYEAFYIVLLDQWGVVAQSRYMLVKTMWYFYFYIKFYGVYGLDLHNGTFVGYGFELTVWSLDVLLKTSNVIKALIEARNCPR